MSLSKLQEVEKNITKMVKDFGHSVMYIFGEEDYPPFHYTVGLPKTYNHPEIIVFGLPHETGQIILNDIAKHIKEGEKFKTGKVYDNLANLPLQFIKVSLKNYKNHLNAAINFNGAANFDTLQLVLCDKDANFPWDKFCDEGFKKTQPLLNS